MILNPYHKSEICSEVNNLVIIFIYIWARKMGCDQAFVLLKIENGTSYAESMAEKKNNQNFGVKNTLYFNGL